MHCFMSFRLFDNDSLHLMLHDIQLFGIDMFYQMFNVTKLYW